MNVITGKARGTRLEAPNSNATRPTSGIVKEAIFNIIQFIVPGAKVLDLFAGSGQLGIEALSRGAALATFVETSTVAKNAILANLKRTKLQDFAVIKQQRAEDFLVSNNVLFDIVILDPPYYKNIINELMPRVIKNTAPNGIIICEMAKVDEVEDNFGAWHKEKTYHYGKKSLVVFKEAN